MLRPGLGALGEGAGGGIVFQLPEQGACFGKCAAPPQRQKYPRAFQQAYGDEIQEPAIYSLDADLTLGAVAQ